MKAFEYKVHLIIRNDEIWEVIPGRDKITPISNISFVLFPPRPHLQSWFPKCHEERAVQKWVFIYPAPNTPNDAFSTLKWGCGGLGFILHVFEMGVIKSRPGTFWHPDFLFAALVGHLSNVFSQRWHYWGDNFVDVLLTSIIFYARRFSSTRLPASFGSTLLPEATRGPVWAHEPVHTYA